MDHPRARPLVSLAVSIVIVGLILFVPAGTIDWPGAWWWLAVFIAAMLVALPVLWRLNPEIFAARTGFKSGTKGWDLALAPLQIGGLLAIPVVAGLDFRFGWSAVPFVVVLVGYAAFLAGFTGMAWAQAVNRFFEPGVRIQTDRGHHVIDTGPYAHVRHPGYISAVLLSAGMALALGSWWALLPVILVTAVLAYRTLREEETLRAELPGYTDFTGRTRYRWIPGIW